MTDWFGSQGPDSDFSSEWVKRPPAFDSVEGQEREVKRMCRETMPCPNPECGKEMRANGYRCSHCGYEL